MKKTGTLRLYQHILEMLAVTLSPGLFFIGGGAIRDYILGRTALTKDIDLVLLSPTPSELEACYKALRTLGYINEPSCFDDNPSSGNGSGDNAFCERWAGCFKWTHPTFPDLDLLVAHTDDIDELLDGFDFNINQYVLQVGDAHPRYLGVDEGRLTQLRPDGIPDERIQKMAALAIAHGWSL